MNNKTPFVVCTVCVPFLILISFALPAKAVQVYKGDGTAGGLVPDFTQTHKNKNGGICAAAAFANSLECAMATTRSSVPCMIRTGNRARRTASTGRTASGS